MLGAHSVGVPDGGPGLPVTRWSTEGGDLRVPHFIGLHALQVLPFAALVLERRRRRASARPIVALGVGWIGLTLVALAQALRAQPVLAPDALTIAAALAIVVAAAAIAIGVPGRGRASSERRAVSRLDRVELQPRS
jgi:peptidoglycan/LPS O-acetylase OafA/YrhL